MARIFITGSSDGLGHHLAKSLIAQGHTVTLHARSSPRAQETLSKTPGASSILIGDLSSISQTKTLAAEANRLGTFDAVIHNAGVGYGQGKKMTEDGIAQVFAVNALAPYVLTSLMSRPGRVVYVSSGLHRGGDGALRDVRWREKRWDGFKAYSDSKFMDVLLSFAVARHWPNVSSNSFSPGWVKTKMGGSSAPDSIDQAVEMLAWLASGELRDVGSGKYYAANEGNGVHPSARNEGVQEEFLRVCKEISGVEFPK